MRVAVFSSKSYDRASLASANEAFGHDLTFLEPNNNNNQNQHVHRLQIPRMAGP